MGSEPVEEEIPLEYEDLYEEVQESILVYNMLQDNVDYMNGIYIGKVIAGIGDVFDIMGVDDKITCYKIIQLLDKERSSIINKKDKKPAKKT